MEAIAVILFLDAIAIVALIFGLIQYKKNKKAKHLKAQRV